MLALSTLKQVMEEKVRLIIVLFTSFVMAVFSLVCVPPEASDGGEGAPDLNV